MPLTKVSLTEEKGTLLVTLLAKAEESKEPDSILRDHFAANVISKIDYDFSKVRVSRDTSIGLALRAKVLDDWTREFISKNPNGTVLNIGCGLDSRVFRVDPPPTIQWIDVDYPEVIDFRTQFYPERTGSYTKIGTSVTAPHWLESVHAEGSVLIVAEGLLYYLSPSEVDELLTRIVNNFSSGNIIFDVYSSLGVRVVNANAAIKSTGAVLRWSIEQPTEIEQKIPSLKLVDEYNAYESKEASRMSFCFRLVLGTIGKTQSFRKLARLLRYRF